MDAARETALDELRIRVAEHGARIVDPLSAEQRARVACVQQAAGLEFELDPFDLVRVAYYIEIGADPDREQAAASTDTERITTWAAPMTDLRRPTEPTA